MEGRSKLVWALLDPLPATLLSTKCAIEHLRPPNGTILVHCYIGVKCCVSRMPALARHYATRILWDLLDGWIWPSELYEWAMFSFPAGHCRSGSRGAHA
eukprot:1161182-Pelagomonas_calceolata.AAC.3